MTQAIEQNLEKPNPQTELTDLWRDLGTNQRRFAVARLSNPLDKDAAAAIGIAPSTVSSWANKAAVRRVIELLQADTRQAAITILAEKAAEAAMVKVAGLESADPRIRQDAASEVLDRVLGKPMQKSEVTGKDGEPLYKAYEGFDPRKV